MMKKKSILSLVGLSAVGLLFLGACGKSGDSAKADKEGKETITFINHKTDWEGNGKWDKYMEEFNKNILILMLKFKLLQIMLVR